MPPRAGAMCVVSDGIKMKYSFLPALKSVAPALRRRHRKRIFAAERRRRALFEQFEDRRMLATITVNTLSDVTANDNLVTLREAIQAANTNTSVDGSVPGNGADTIVFRSGLEGQISLSQGELIVSESLTIRGPGADRLEVSGGDASRVLLLGGTGSHVYVLENLTLADGNGASQFITGYGGAIAMNDVDDTLEIHRSVIGGSRANYGGAVYVADATLNISDTSIVENLATSTGGGLLLQNVDAELIDVTISGNTADAAGGGIAHQASGPSSTSTLSIINGTIAENDSPLGAGIRNLSDGGAALSKTKYLNTIFASNEGSSNVVSENVGGSGAEIVSLGYNLSDDYSGNLSSLGDLDGVDPLLGPLGFYGGPTPNHPLLPGSPALDSGLSDYRQAVTDHSYRALYSMNDDVGLTQVVDDVLSTSTFYNGTAIGGVSRADGAPIGGESQNAIDFNGVDGYVDFPNSPSLNLTSFTVEAWAKVEGGDGTYRTVIMSRSDDNSNNTDARGFNIYVGPGNRWEFWTGNLDLTTGPGGEWDVLSGPTVVNNQWTHIVATFQETSLAGSVRLGTKSLYIDGALVASGTDRPYAENQTAPLHIGAAGTENGTPGLFFNGVIDEVGIGSTVLTATQVERRYQATKVASEDQRGVSRIDDGVDIGAVENSVSMVGVNFVGGGFSAGAAVSGPAGVLPQTNWNNVADNGASSTGGAQSGSAGGLIDTDGNVTSASVNWNATNTWTISNQPPADEDARLMNGYLDTDSATPTTVSIADVPFSLYDVYVYVDGDGTGRKGLYSIDDGVSSYTVGPVLDDMNWPIAAGNGSFNEAVAPEDSGNYVVFRGLSGSDFQLDATPVVSRAPINAIQIVGHAPRLLVDTLGDLDDDDPTNGMTLREAVNLANASPGHQVITFDLPDGPQTIVLDGQQLRLTDDVTIRGPGADRLVIDADHQSRVLQVDAGVSAVISGLTVQNGVANEVVAGQSGLWGGGISNTGKLTLTDAIIIGNSARSGGGVANSGSLTVQRTTFLQNRAFPNGVNWGGGLYSDDGIVFIAASTFHHNSAGEGGGLKVQFGDVEIVNSTFVANVADSRGGAIQLGADPRVRIISSTITDNTSGNLGGGVEVFSGQLTLQDTLVTGNIATNGDPNVASAASRLTLLGENRLGGAQVGPLGDHGGPTQTALPRSGAGVDAITPTAYSAMVLAANPVAYWRLGDDPTGAIAQNLGSTGTAADGSFLGRPSVAESLLRSDSVNTAIRFDGFGDGVAVADNPLLNTSAVDAYTIELTFNADDVASRQVLYEQGGVVNGFNVYLESEYLIVGAWKNNGNTFAAYQRDRVRAGVTHHVALVFDAPTQSFTGYLNGSPFRSSTLSGAIEQMPDHASNIGIGTMRDATRVVPGDAGTGIGGSGFYFAGTIDDVALYRTALSQQQIRDHVAAANVTQVDQRGVARPQGSGHDVGAVELATEAVVDPLIVNVLGDVDDGDLGNGQTTLREAVNAANRMPGSQSIQFDLGEAPQTITLDGNELKLTDDVSLLAPIGNLITIDAGGRSRVIQVAPGVTAIISDLNLTGGNANPRGDEVELADGAGWIDGGAILNDRGFLTVTRTEIYGNEAFNGGGIGHVGATELTVIDSYIHDNQASQWGGGVASQGTALQTATQPAVLRVEGTTIDHNNSGLDGGGVHTFQTDLQLTSSTVSNNQVIPSSPTGVGGIVSNGPLSSAAIIDATIIGNLGISLSTDAPMNVNNTIVAGLQTDIQLVGSGSISGQFNLIGDPSSAGGFTNGVGNNIVGKDDMSGGRTRLAVVEIVDSTLGDFGGFAPTYRLLPASPAIDQGSSTAISDQRGIPYTRFSGAGADIGAYEVQAAASQVLTVVTTNDIVNSEILDSDGLSLREALMLANGIPGSDVILFDFSTDASIELFGGELMIRDDVTILNSQPTSVSIDADGRSRVIQVSQGTQAELANLTITDGLDYIGGGVLNYGDLTIRDSHVVNNRGVYGSGIYNSSSTSTLKIIGSTLSGNQSASELSSGGNGGGIYNNGTGVDIVNSTISGNHAFSFGGGIYSLSGQSTVHASTITNNSAGSGAGGVFVTDGTMFLSQSIVAGNRSRSNPEFFSGPSGEITSLGNNVLHAGSGGQTSVWDSGIGANGHAYQVVAAPGGIDWESANQAAIAAGGHLASITSSEENAFVFSLIDDSNFWRYVNSVGFGPWIGGTQASTGTEPDGGWSWLGSEAFGYSNWATNEPSNSAGSEDRLHFFSTTATTPDSRWNDMWSGSTRPVAYVIEYDQATYRSSDIIGVDPMLDLLADNGGPTPTHGLLAGSPAVDAADQVLVTPAAVTLDAGTEFYPVIRLIDNSGLPSVPDIGNYGSMQHATTNPNTAWVTNGSGADYFAAPVGETPVLTFDLGGLYDLSALVVWGLMFDVENNNEAKEIVLEFSRDGGISFGDTVNVTHQRSAIDQETISLGGSYLADTVRMTIVDNHYGTPGAPGGDRVGLGEVKFISGVNVDQRDAARPVGVAGDSGAFEGTVTAATRPPLIVNALGDHDDGDPNNSEMTLREAINLANLHPGQDIITFDFGGQPQTIQIDRELSINDDLVIDGPGAALLTIDASGHSRVLRIDPLVFLADIRGVTLTGGRAPSVFNYGGGILTFAETLLISDSEIVENSANIGGGISSLTGAVVITDSTLSHNHATTHSGAVYVTKELTLIRSDVTDNSARYAAGIYNNGGIVRIKESAVSYNEARDHVGGIFNTGRLYVEDSIMAFNRTDRYSGAVYNTGVNSEAVFTRVRMTGNVATSTTLYGGGAIWSNGYLKLVESVLDQNEAGLYGGAIASRGRLELIGTTLSENRANRGGAIYSSGNASIFASTLSNNVSSNMAGAIYNASGPDENLVIDFSTLTDNFAENDYGGIYTDTSGTSPIRISNSILAGNAAGNGPFTDLYVGALSSVTAQNNLVGQGGGGNTNVLAGHLYEVVSVPGGITYEDAAAAARLAGGYLASISSDAENDFVKSLINDPLYWRSYQDGENFTNYGPWIGGKQMKDSVEPSSGFRWEDNSSVTLSSSFWTAGQPDNHRGNEDAIQYLSFSTGQPQTTGGWNDEWRLSTNPVAYVIEYDFSQFNASNVFASDPRLGPLQDNGGPTPTHSLGAGSAALDAAGTAESYADTVLADSPRVYYRLNETDGPGVIDASPNGTNAVSGPNPPAAPGLKFGESSLPGLGTSALFTNGAPDSSVQVPGLGSHAAITIEAWVYPQSRPSTGDFDVIYNSRNFGLGAVHLQFIDSGTLRFTINGAGEADFGTGTDFPLDTWTHVVATFDNATDEAKVYANGQLLQTFVFSGNQDAALTIADVGMWNASIREFDGRIDDFAIYTSVLSDERIQTHYQAAFHPGRFEQRGAPFTRVVGTAADIGSFESFGYDFGDAPASYGVTLGSDGPVHLASGPQLGTIRDAELDGTPGLAADGDDLAGDDEDGVSFVQPWIAGLASDLQVTSSSGGGILDYFVDFDGDGTFGNVPGEVFQTTLSGGTETISIAVPSFVDAGTHFARFRISTAGGLGPGGLADDGEVEDYAIEIYTPALVVSESDGTTIVNENGTTDTVTVALGAPPQTDVVVTITNSDPSEASIAPTTLTFAPGDWNVPQLVTVTGLADQIIDRNQTPKFVFSVDTAISDPLYASAADVAVLATVVDVDQVDSESSGGGQSYNTMQPFATTNYAIALTGIYPSRDGGVPVASFGSEPFIGEIIQFAGNFAPRGYALAAGQLMSIAQNTALFSLLGTTFGGDGEVTFGLPDLRGRAPITVGNGVLWGQKSGTELATLTESHLAQHDHPIGNNVTGIAGDGQSFVSPMPTLGLQSIMDVNGEVRWVGFNFAPSGFGLPHGQLLSIAQNAALFSNFGTLYGGNGSTTFNLPDLRGRVLIDDGAGTGLTQRSTGDVVSPGSVSLTVGNLPTHDHTIPGTPDRTGVVGNADPFSIMQPSIVVNYQIAVSGLYPSRNLVVDGNGLAAVGEDGNAMNLGDAQAMLNRLAGEGIRRWRESGISVERLQALESAEYEFAALGDGVLGEVGRPGVVSFDLDAAGWGWYIDVSPELDDEFTVFDPANGWLATSPRANGRIDLLTAMMHEQGHLLGLAHDAKSGQLLSPGLQPGVRRLPSGQEVTADDSESGTELVVFIATPFIAQIHTFATPESVFDTSTQSVLMATDGTILPISQNQALFSLLGITYGGDGETNFGVPDFQGRAVIGQGSGPGLTSRGWGQIGGSETVALSVNEMPSHTHSIPTGATLIVDSLNDEVDGDRSAGEFSLREAIALSNAVAGQDHIVFAESLSGETITLSMGELQITESVSIDASSLPENVTIDAAGFSRVLHITSTGGDVSMFGLNITGGQVQGDNMGSANATFSGAGIRFDSGGNLTIHRSAVTNSHASGGSNRGGGIFATGSVTLQNSTVSGNSVSGTSSVGGGIFATQSVFIDHSTIHGNRGFQGGGIFNDSDLRVVSSTVAGNSAVDQGGGIFNAGTAVMVSSIVAANLISGSGAANDIHAAPGFLLDPTSSYNLVGDSATAGGLVNDATNRVGVDWTTVLENDAASPTLADNGGPMATIALLAGSDAIDTGISTSEFDQRGPGYVRQYGGGVDIGAFEFQVYDFGDAPATYGTELPNGARHAPLGPRLGDTRDIEINGQPSDAADGDDVNGDDEDGVMFGVIGIESALAAVNVELQNAVTARVDAWLDFNGDGIWDAAEKIIDNRQVYSGLQTLNFQIPAGLTARQTYARVRVSSQGGLDVDGPADDGEVEDYRVSLVQQTAPSVKRVDINGGDSQRSVVTSVDVTFNGLVDTSMGAFQITNRETGQSIQPQLGTPVFANGETTVRLSFAPGPSVVTRPIGGNSLIDGTYELTIDPFQVSNQGGGANMIQPYSFGSDEADTFFRLYGDSDGDRDVDGQDYGRIALSFLKPSGDPEFASHLDSDGDGDVDGQDYGRFGQRLMKSL